MKIKHLFIITFILTVFSGAALYADTPTATPTLTISPTWTISETHTVSPTITETHTVSPTFTVTPTITQTHTITPTFTITPTPQKTVFVYPNPVAYNNSLSVAYPIIEGKNAVQLEVKIYAINGDHVVTIARDLPDGYTTFDITDLARGIYIYKVIVRYSDSTEDTSEFKKFVVIK